MSVLTSVYRQLFTFYVLSSTFHVSRFTSSSKAISRQNNSPRPPSSDTPRRRHARGQSGGRGSSQVPSLGYRCRANHGRGKTARKSFLRSPPARRGRDRARATRRRLHSSRV